MSKQETPEEKALRLETENAKLKTDLASATSKFKELEKDHNTNKVALEKANKGIEAAELGKSTMEAKFNELVISSTKEIGELSEQLNSASKDAGSAFPILTRNRRKFQIVGKKFNYNNREITVEDIRNDGQLADELIKKEVGFLIEITN